MRMYDLIPTNGRKSFYGKAKVEIDDNGTETLISYNTPIMRRLLNGNYIRLCDRYDTAKDWRYQLALSNTTCAHIKSFSGLNKEEYLKLEKETS